MAFYTPELYLFNPVVSTDELTSTMDTFLKEWIKYHSFEDDMILYHYTTLNGLKGILENRAIWLSHVSQLNDPMEIQYGKRVITDLINDKMKDENNANLRSFYHTLQVQVGTFGDIMHHPFIFCFCENGDLLSQWREYSDRDGGYNFGIELSEKTKISLQSDSFKNGRIPHLRKIIYNKDEQLNIINRYLDMIIDCVSSIISKGNLKPGLADMSHFASVMAMQAVNVLLDVLMTFKHPAFEEEKEWRLIYITSSSFQPENLHFRDDLIPYHILNLYDSLEDGTLIFPIKSINYGPRNESQRTRSSLRLYVQHVAHNDSIVEIKPESILIQGTSYQIKR
jgi:hypothetical protein